MAGMAGVWRGRSGNDWGVGGMAGAIAWIPVFTGMTGGSDGVWRGWRESTRHTPPVEQECPSFPRHSPVSSLRHSRENGNPRVIPRSESRNAYHPPSVIPVKTGIHASAPTGERESPASPCHSPVSSPRHSRENGNPHVRPDRGAGIPGIPPPCPRIIPPVIPVKTGIHASNPDQGAGMPASSPRHPPVIPVKTGIHASDPDHGAGMPASSPRLGPARLP